MQLFDAIENCFPAMKKQYRKLSAAGGFLAPGTDGARAAGEMVDWTQSTCSPPA